MNAYDKRARYELRAQTRFELTEQPDNHTQRQRAHPEEVSDQRNLRHQESGDECQYHGFNKGVV